MIAIEKWIRKVHKAFKAVDANFRAIFEALEVFALAIDQLEERLRELEEEVS